MSADDRCTPKEIKSWCHKTLLRYADKPSATWYRNMTHLDVIELMHRAYKRGYEDGLSG